MRYEHLYVSGLGSWLPPAMTTEEAVRNGLCEPDSARRSEMVSVTVARDEEPPPEMAARAARTALARAGGHDDVAIVLHATLFDQGFDLWSSAAYVQRAAVGNRCPALEVRQVSNGGMAATDLAAAYLRADPARRRALVTCGDRFALPGFDRWRSDPGTAYADGGAALVLSSVGGFARLRSLVLVSEPALEGMHRDGPAFGIAPPGGVRPVDLGRPKRAYLDEVGPSVAIRRIVDGQREAMERALDEAGVRLGDVDRLVLPHLGRRRLESNYLRHMNVALERTTWAFDRHIGHLGAGDQFVSLENLVLSGGLTSGQTCLLMGVGAGFTWSSAVLEMLAVPDWAGRPS